MGGGGKGQRVYLSGLCLQGRGESNSSEFGICALCIPTLCFEVSLIVSPSSKFSDCRAFTISLHQVARVASRRHYHSKCTHTHNGGEKKGMVFHHHQLEKVRVTDPVEGVYHGCKRGLMWYVVQPTSSNGGRSMSPARPVAER